MEKFLRSLIVVGISVLTLTGRAETEVFSPKFYVFYNGLGFGDLETEVQSLKEMGYSGISTVMGAGYGRLPELVAGYEKEGLGVLSIYMNVDDKPLPEAFLTHLKDRDALAEVTVTKQSEHTVAALRASAELAQGLNVKLSLYPHNGFSVATVSKALKLIKEVNHPNLGVSFNLAHFLKGEKSADLEAVITEAAPYLRCVNINGANITGTGWDDFILPLDEGSFPQERLLKALKGINYKGPVGLQCYGVKGDKVENLKRAYEEWSTLLVSLKEGEE